jgi:hypothetical protein
LRMRFLELRQGSRRSQSSFNQIRGEVSLPQFPNN